MIIEHNWIAMPARFADTAKAGPDGRDTLGSEDRTPSGFVEDLVALIYNLHVLGLSHGSIGIGRRAVATNAGERNAVKVEERRGQVGRHEIQR
jgi:hypothetical protein